MPDRNGIGDVERDDVALARAVAGSFERMPDEARARVRSRVLAVATADARTERLLRAKRWLPAFVVATAVLGGASGATAAAAPGDPLYPVKQAAAQAAATVERTLGIQPPPEGGAGGNQPQSGSSQAGGVQGPAETNGASGKSPTAAKKPSAKQQGSRVGTASAGASKSGKNGSAAASSSKAGKDKGSQDKGSNSGGSKWRHKHQAPKAHGKSSRASGARSKSSKH